MIYNKKWTIVLLAILSIMVACGKSGKTVTDSDDGKAEPEEVNYPGLSVSASGDLLLNGESYRAIGVNYFNAFTRTLDEGNNDDTSYRKGLAYLKERNIPFIRFAVNGYWPSNWKLYLENPDGYFRQLDAFVAAAEEFGIGLIPSFFWHTPTLPDLVGEPVNQWGNTTSKTHILMRKFVSDVVLRYRDSQAIWGWEQGNEVNLLVDLPGDTENLPPVVAALGTPDTRSKADKLYTNDLIVMMTAFAKEVRKHDGTRIIITGNAVSRPAARHLWKNQNWTKDSRSEFIAMLGVQNPDPIDVLCMHVYPGSADEGYFADESAGVDGIIRAGMDAARSLKKPLFLGEWGAQETKYGAQTRDKFVEMLEAIENNHVPLSAMWVFDYPPHDTEDGINVSPDNGPREYMLQEIMEANERMRLR